LNVSSVGTNILLNSPFSGCTYGGLNEVHFLNSKSPDLKSITISNNETLLGNAISSCSKIFLNLSTNFFLSGTSKHPANPHVHENMNILFNNSSSFVSNYLHSSINTSINVQCCLIKFSSVLG